MWVCENAPHSPCTLKAAGQVPLQGLYGPHMNVSIFLISGMYLLVCVCVHVFCGRAFIHMMVHQNSATEMCAHLCENVPSQRPKLGYPEVGFLLSLSSQGQLVYLLCDSSSVFTSSALGSRIWGRTPSKGMITNPISLMIQGPLVRLPLQVS